MPSRSSTSASSASSGERLTVTMSQNAGVCGGGAFGVECADVEFAQVGRDMVRTAIAVPTPQAIPVVGGKILFAEIAPSDVMAAVVGWQINAICFVVRGDNDAATIEDAVLAQVLLVNTQHVRRRCRIGFHVVVPSVAIDLTEIAGFVDAQHYGFEEAVEPPEHVRRHHLDEIPRTNRTLDRFEQRVLAGALPAAEY